MLCLFFAMWFISGVVMMYVGYPKLTPQERLSHLAPLDAAAVLVTPEQALAAAGRGTATGLPVGKRLDADAGTGEGAGAGAGAGEGESNSSRPSSPQANSGVPPMPLAQAPGDRPDATGLVLNASRGGEPVYVVPGAARKAPQIVDARSGALLPPADADVALASARAWFGGDVAASYAGTVQEDVYTHSRGLDMHRPLHRVDMSDAAHTRLYVSSATGAVVLDATRKERAWNYVGAWIHWLYPLRGNALDPWWHDVVVWLSVAGVALALSGTVVGILRWRFSRPYASGSRSPYRESMMRWHHISGLLFAVITITWIFSGLMSMNPWKLFTSTAAPLVTNVQSTPVPPAGAPAGSQPGSLPDSPPGSLSDSLPGVQPDSQLSISLATPGALLAALPSAPRELSWASAAGQNVVLARNAARAPYVLSAERATPHTVSEAELRAAAAHWLPGASLREVQVLRNYDFYYYARDEHAMLGHVEKPLPVWRLVYDNPEATWVYLDPHTGQIQGRQDRSARVSRWLFSFLHSWDWTGLLARRPLWDALLIFLSLGGAALSLTGVVIGWKRLGKKLRS